MQTKVNIAALRSLFLNKKNKTNNNTQFSWCKKSKFGQCLLFLLHIRLKKEASADTCAALYRIILVVEHPAHNRCTLIHRLCTAHLPDSIYRDILASSRSASHLLLPRSAGPNIRWAARARFHTDIASQLAATTPLTAFTVNRDQSGSNRCCFHKGQWERLPWRLKLSVPDVCQLDAEFEDRLGDIGNTRFFHPEPQRTNLSFQRASRASLLLRFALTKHTLPPLFLSSSSTSM